MWGAMLGLALPLPTPMGSPKGSAAAHLGDDMMAASGMGMSVNTEATHKVRNLSKLQIQELQDVFEYCDKDGDGTIDLSEMDFAMKNLGINMSPEEIKEMIRDVDEDGSGSIEFEEFQLMMTKKMGTHDTEKKIREAFHLRFDEAGTGMMSAADLRSSMLHLNEVETPKGQRSKKTHKLTAEEIDELIRDAGFDCEGELNYNKFVKYILNQNEFCDGGQLLPQSPLSTRGEARKTFPPLTPKPK